MKVEEESVVFARFFGMLLMLFLHAGEEPGFMSWQNIGAKVGVGFVFFAC